MKRAFKISCMAILGVLTVCLAVGTYIFVGGWTSILFYIAIAIVALRLKKAWKYWVVCVSAFTYGLTVAYEMPKVVEEGNHVKLVTGLYPVCPKVYIEGKYIVDSVEVVSGYSTYCGWFYRSEKAHLMKLTDSSQVTTILSGKEVLFKGKDMLLEEYEGEHGPVTLFSYTDIKTGERIRRDYYDGNPDDQSYTPHVRDDADYILNYNM